MSFESFWKAITANMGLKILSLFFALFLWFYVTAQIEGIETVQVPIEVLNIPDSLVIVSDIPRYAQVNVKGSRSELLKVRLFGNIRLTVDIGGVQGRELTVPLSRGMVSLPEGLKSEGVSIVSPRTLSILLEKRASKVIPVKPFFKGSLPKDLAFLKSPEIAPDRVIVRGPERTVEELSEVETEPIEIVARRGRFSIECELYAPSNVDIEPKKVIVEMEISRRAERTIEGIVPTVVQSEEGYSAKCSPEFTDLMVSGPEELVRNLRPEDISILLSIPVGVRGTVYLKPEVIVPSGIDSTRTSVDAFEITVMPRY